MDWRIKKVFKRICTKLDLNVSEEQEKVVKPAFKFEGVRYSGKYGHDVCILHMLGRNVFAELDPREIIATPEILDSLSIQDVIEVSRLLERLESDIAAERCEIVAMTLEGGEHPDKFTAVKIGSPHYRVFSLNEINVNSPLIRKFSPRNAFLLGLHKANLDMLAESKLIKEMQLKSQQKELKKRMSLVKQEKPT